MELYYKITTGVLLLLHCFHMGLFQDPQDSEVTDPPGFTTEESWYPDSDDVTVDHTDSAGRTIDKEWLRGKPVNERTEEEVQENMVSSGEMTTMSISSGEGSDAAGPDQEANETFGDNATVLSTSLLVSPNETVTAETTTAPTTTTTTTTAVPTTAPAELINETEAEEGSAHPPTTSFLDISNDTDLNDVTTVTAETNVTQAGTGPETNVTENAADVTTTEVPLIDAEPTTLTTTDLPPPPPETTVADASNDTTTAASNDTTTAAPDTPDATNMTLDGQASGTNSERGNSGGLASDAASGKRSRRSEAWSAILGTGVAVAFVGMVVYVIVRKRNQRDFSHRKLVEEFPSDPVLRLDNNEPLDLDFGGSAYYNRAMQADDIQMNSFPGGQQR